jgi:ATP-binding cassette subfamily B protein
MHKNRSIFSFLLDAVKPFKFYVALHLIVIIYNAIDLSLWPYLSKLLVDKLNVTPREQVFAEVWPIALWLIIFTILPGIIWRICDFSWTKMTPALKKKITIETTNYVTQHSHNFFQNHFSGSLANKIRDLANASPRIIEIALYSFLNVGLSLIVAFFALLSIHKYFAFGLLIWAILFIATAIKSGKKTSDMSSEISDQQSKIMGNIVDVLSNIANVKFFSRRNFEQKRIADFQDRYTVLSEKRGWFMIKFYSLQAATLCIYFALCIVALIWLYTKNLVTLGDFLMLFTINNFAIHLMWQAANELRHFMEELGTAKQALQILDIPLEIKDGDKILQVSKGEIIFKNVEFAYKDSAALFSKKSITIKAGEKVGLVGHSGGGKSTFVNLILRSFDVTSGRILIDGQDISQVSQDSLRRAIGLIPQDPSLFHRTLSENISYGAENASNLDVIEAAKNAHAHEFIQGLPKRYDSLVGERGVKLSGGQRQRIAIARAFLKNAPILILDEATSQLDSITENFIQDSLRTLMQNKTTIVVAHRLSTLQIMDRILVFDHGKIVEDGSHHELLEQNGTYKKLWDAQVGGVLTNAVEEAEAFLVWDFTENPKV